MVEIKNGSIVTLYEDKEKTKPILPITKTSAIKDNDNESLDVILNKMPIYDEQEVQLQANKINAETLGGVAASEYMKKADYVEADGTFALAKRALNADNANNANNLNNIPASDYAKKSDLNSYAKKEDLSTFACVVDPSKWITKGAEGSYYLNQEMNCEGMLSTYTLFAPEVRKTNNKIQNEKLQESLNSFNENFYFSTADGKIVISSYTVATTDKLPVYPEEPVVLFFRRAVL